MACSGSTGPFSANFDDKLEIKTSTINSNVNSDDPVIKMVNVNSGRQSAGRSGNDGADDGNCQKRRSSKEQFPSTEERTGSSKGAISENVSAPSSDECPEVAIETMENDELKGKQMETFRQKRCFQQVEVGICDAKEETTTVSSAKKRNPFHAPFPSSQTEAKEYDDPDIQAETTEGQSKRPFSNLCSDCPIDTTASDASQDHAETGDTIFIVPPAILPTKLAYVLLEELLAANESWTRFPNEAQPLRGTCFADMIDDDYYSLIKYFITRTTAKHIRLNAFKQMPVMDRITLIRAKLPSVISVDMGIRHSPHEKTIFIDYPGCPQICDDFTRRYPNDGHNRLHRLGSSYPVRYRDDKPLALILSVMAVFGADYDIGKNLTSQSRGYYHEMSRMYSELLKGYLLSTYGAAEGLTAHRLLTTWLNCIGIFSKSYKRAIATFDVDPITFGIMNLELHFIKKKWNSH